MKRKFTEEIKSCFILRKKKYLIVTACLILGVLAGSFCGINAGRASDDGAFFSSFISVYKLRGISVNDLFLRSFTANTRTFLLLWISGFFIWFAPLNLLTCAAKGFGIGYAMSYLILENGFAGFAFSLICMFFQNIFVIPIMIIYSVYQLDYSYLMYKNKAVASAYKRTHKSKVRNLLYLGLIILSGCICSIIEANIVPALIGLIYGNFT